MIAADDDARTRKEPRRVNGLPELSGGGGVGLDKGVNRSVREMEPDRQPCFQYVALCVCFHTRVVCQVDRGRLHPLAAPAALECGGKPGKPSATPLWLARRKVLR